ENRRKVGFTTVHVVPSGRIAGGQASLLTTSGLPLREAVIVSGTLPLFQLYDPPGAGYPSTLMGATAHLRQAFLDAGRYRLHHSLYAGQTPGVARAPAHAGREALGEALERK